MNGTTSFGAPWSPLLKLMSAFSVAILVFAGAVLLSSPPLRVIGDGAILAFAMTAVVATFVGGALFTIRGYELAGSELLVQRLLWATRIPLHDLRSAWADSLAMKGSMRLFGNGGMFSFSGLFSNRKLGHYRAFATDPRNAVVLRFAKRTVVITPGAPRDFLRTLSVHCPQVRIQQQEV